MFPDTGHPLRVCDATVVTVDTHCASLRRSAPLRDVNFRSLYIFLPGVTLERPPSGRQDTIARPACEPGAVTPITSWAGTVAWSGLEVVDTGSDKTRSHEASCSSSESTVPAAAPSPCPHGGGEDGVEQGEGARFHRARAVAARRGIPARGRAGPRGRRATGTSRPARMRRPRTSTWRRGSPAIWNGSNRS